MSTMKRFTTPPTALPTPEVGRDYPLVPTLSMFPDTELKTERIGALLHPRGNYAEFWPGFGEW